MKFLVELARFTLLLLSQKRLKLYLSHVHVEPLESSSSSYSPVENVYLSLYPFIFSKKLSIAIKINNDLMKITRGFFFCVAFPGPKSIICFEKKQRKFE